MYVLRKIWIFHLDELLGKWNGRPKVAKTGAMSIPQHRNKIMKAAKMSV